MRKRDQQLRSQAARCLLAARREILAPAEVFMPTSSASTVVRARLAQVEALLRDGRDADAILLANVGALYDWAHQPTVKIGKANFNPNEPRDDRTKQWTRFGGESKDAEVNEVQYRGHFHDIVLDKLLEQLKAQGDKVIKGPRIIGVNGMVAIPDALAIGKTANVPYFIEIKTGDDPPFTANQASVYPLICEGGHATSFDPRMSAMGFISGAPLPPIDILLITTAGPNMPMNVTDYCHSIRLR